MKDPPHPESVPSAPSGVEAFASRLADTTDDLLAAVEPTERRLVWTNPAWRALLGWSEEELRAEALDRLVEPGDAEALEALLGGEARQVDLRLRDREGVHRTVAFLASRAPDAALVFLSGRDVTERRQEVSEERYRAVTDAAHDGVVSADINGRIIAWNPGAEAMFGRSRADALGQPLQLLMPERYRDAHRAGMARFVATGEERLIGSTIEVEGLRADGSEFPIDLTLATWIQSGQRYFTGVLRDATERVEGRRALRAAEERFAATWEGAAVGLLLAAPDGTLLQANRALCEMAERGEEELVGRPVADLLAADDPAARADAIEGLLAGATERLTTRRRMPTGSGERMVRVNASLARSPAGEPLYFLAQVEDAAAEHAIEERAGELERSNAELEQFAYVASHELSEPLRMVSSHLQLLRRRYRGRLDPDADGFIDYAVDGAARMRELIDALLSYSRAGRGGRPFEQVDTRAVAEQAAAAARTQDGGADARIEIGALPTVSGDPQALGQLFQNLVANAVKFVPPGRAAEVAIGAERDGAEWSFAIDDNGVGLDPGHADRIFSMFQRLHTRDEYEGTGIGLAIAKKVVEHHGGRVWAEPRAGGGSRFCFTLPG